MFQAYEIAWSGRGELATITTLEPSGSGWRLTDRNLYCGLYVNELIVRLIARGDVDREFFDLYERTIEVMAAGRETERQLRTFEIGLLQTCGYGLPLDVQADSGDAIDPGRTYYYHIEIGALNTQQGAAVPIRGDTLLRLASDDMLDERQAVEAKRLMRFVIDYYLGDRPLAARSLFKATQ